MFRSFSVRRLTIFLLDLLISFDELDFVQLHHL